MKFTGKVAIVTGSASGIGEGIVRRLAEDGASVVVADLNEEGGRGVVQKIEREGGKALFVKADVSSPESCQAMAEATAKAFGRVDFLVNNAALFKGMRLDGLLAMDLDYYLKFMLINAHGVLIATRAVLPHMQAAGGGAIVNTSSTAAYMGAGAYTVAKLAVNGITMSLARELGPQNIRINAIAPGPTDTPALRNEMVTDEFIAGMVSQMPLARLGTPLDHAKAVSFLLSDEAAWITGHILNVDGGQWMRV